MATATIALLLIQLSGLDKSAYTEKLVEAWLPHRCQMQGDSYALVVVVFVVSAVQPWVRKQ